MAWLRACHGKIFSDIDTHDPVKLRRKQFAPSKSKPKRYNLSLGGNLSDSSRPSVLDQCESPRRDINIPSVEEAFKEFCKSRRLHFGQYKVVGLSRLTSCEVVSRGRAHGDSAYKLVRAFSWKPSHPASTWGFRSKAWEPVVWRH